MFLNKTIKILYSLEQLKSINNKDLNNNKINEVTNRRNKIGMALFGGDKCSPSTKRMKLDTSTKHNFMQKFMCNSQTTLQPQQQTIKAFLGKK